MPDFTVPPEWEGPGWQESDVFYTKLCPLAHDVTFEMMVAFNEANSQHCVLLIDGPDDDIVLPMKSVQAAFDVAEAISGALWLEDEHA